MKNYINSLFAKSEPRKALPAPGQLPEYSPDLLFPKKAGTSKRMRTRARCLDGDTNTQTWLQAVEISPLSDWQVSRVERSLNLDRVKTLPADAHVLGVIPQGQPVSLRQAATRLAEFEYGALANETFTGPTKEELGELHYETALARENVVFDTNGQPHATVNGMIVDGGFFTEETYETALKAKAAVTKDSAPNISILEIAEAMGTEDLVTALENRLYLVKFSKNLQNIQAGLQSCMKEAYGRRFEGMKNFFGEEGNSSYYYTGSVGAPLGKLNNEVDALKDTPMHKSLLLFVYQYQLFALTTILVDAYKRFEMLTEDQHLDAMNDVIENKYHGLKYYIGETCNIMERNGANADKLRKFRNLVLLQEPAQSMAQMQVILDAVSKDISSLVDADGEGLKKLISGECFGLFDKLGMKVETKPEPAKENAPQRRSGGIHITI